MEYIEGCNIDEYIKANPKAINDIFVQTISGFKYLEDNGIMHRDIRPGNILVSTDGIPKIIDFGFGKTLRKQLIAPRVSVLTGHTQHRKNSLIIFTITRLKCISSESSLNDL